MLRDEKAVAFRRWILAQKNTAYKLQEGENDSVHLVTESAEGIVDFAEMTMTVVELRIVDRLSNEFTFYLHFELNDIEHAHDLFNEMKQCLLEEKPAKEHIVFCCSSALTSSYFAMKMEEACNVLKAPYEFEGISVDRIRSICRPDWTVLLAPQASHEYTCLKKDLYPAHVLKIPPKVFGTYDTSGILRMLSQNENERKNVSLPLKLQTNVQNLLAIAVICTFDLIKITYRVYQDGMMIKENTIIKRKYAVSDLEDIADVVTAMYDVDVISIATPGVLCEGKLTFKRQNILGQEVQKRFEKRYGKKIVFANDANAMAAGYYVMNPDKANISFYFHPGVSRTCGIGNVIDGKMHRGNDGLSGEMQYLVNVLNFSDDPGDLAKTRDGSIELAARYLTAVIAVIAPQCIVIFCEMMPDLVELKAMLADNIEANYLPQLQQVNDVTEYMFQGAAALAG